MSGLDEKVAHLRQDMSLYRRQLENKRGDDEVSVWLVVDALEAYFYSILTIWEFDGLFLHCLVDN